MAKNLNLLSDLVGRADMMEMICNRCGRHGRLSVARLAREYAPETPLATILRDQTLDCPNRNAPAGTRAVRPVHPTLLPLFGGF
jgi:hypothetical protein